MEVNVYRQLMELVRRVSCVATMLVILWAITIPWWPEGRPLSRIFVVTCVGTLMGLMLDDYINRKLKR